MKFTVVVQTSSQFRSFLIALALGSPLSGCTAVSSLQPPYEVKDIVTQPNLTGIWDQDEDGCSDQPIEGLKVVSVGQPASKSYELDEISPKGWVIKYDVNLVRLKDFSFVDAVFDRVTVTSGDEISSGDVPALRTHFFARTWIEGDHIRLAAPEADSLEEVIQNQQPKVQLQKISGDIFLTGDTPEIRDFLVEYAEQIFPESQSCGFTRRK